MFPLSCCSKLLHVRRSGKEHFESKNVHNFGHEIRYWNAIHVKHSWMYVSSILWSKLVLHWRIWSMNSKETFSRDAAHIIDLQSYKCTPVPDFSTVKHMKFICYLFEQRYTILTYMWRIGIKCKMKQIWGYFIDVQMLHIISPRTQISHNVKYWYEICDVLVPIFHALWRIGTKFSQCEICEMWNLRFNKAPSPFLFLMNS